MRVAMRTRARAIRKTCCMARAQGAFTGVGLGCRLRKRPGQRGARDRVAGGSVPGLSGQLVCEPALPCAHRCRCRRVHRRCHDRGLGWSTRGAYGDLAAACAGRSAQLMWDQTKTPPTGRRFNFAPRRWISASRVLAACRRWSCWRDGEPSSRRWHVTLTRTLAHCRACSSR